MKKKFLGPILGLLILLGMSGINNSVKAEPDQWYITETSFVYIDGHLYIKSECTDRPGSDCNMPESIHLIQLPRIWW